MSKQNSAPPTDSDVAAMMLGVGSVGTVILVLISPQLFFGIGETIVAALFIRGVVRCFTRKPRPPETMPD